MKKIVSSFVATSIILTGFSGVVHASGNTSPTSQSVESYQAPKLLENQYVDENGDLYTFESKQKKDLYVQMQKNTASASTQVRSITIGGAPAYKVSSKRYNMQFGGYISSSWTKKKEYTMVAGRSYGFSATVEGFGVNFNFTYEDGGVIPADSKRYSKLAKYADFTLTKYRVVHPKVGTYYVTKKSVHDTYIRVKYK
ncbi:hypothetical protein [Macrococcus carouselicus]|uniref:DUF5626 domain-containing protein n=1 Tax=Macrococcus carouselicus TaxID=69969 RepID=A0A9Q8FQ33_9STAP|nr:hypothetical protein [Macrococcus carouselicus]TDL95542.1 hypothetical protein ERX40_10185 [Macrococcus carouselicus]